MSQLPQLIYIINCDYKLELKISVCMLVNFEKKMLKKILE